MRAVLSWTRHARRAEKTTPKRDGTRTACTALALLALTLPAQGQTCLLYTSDAADEPSSVDLGGRRIIKKKNTRPGDAL